MGQKAKNKAKKFIRESHEREIYNRKQIEAALAKRPYLWERHDLELMKEQSKRKALLKIAAAVMNGTKKKNWREDKDRAGIFDEDEKDVR